MDDQGKSEVTQTESERGLGDLSLDILVGLLNDNCQQFYAPTAALIETIDGSRHLNAGIESFPDDMLSVHEALLKIPSSYISDKFGGSTEQSINERINGIGTLSAICDMARYVEKEEGKLILDIPATAADTYVDPLKLEEDPSLLANLPVMQGTLRFSEKNRKTDGDTSGFPVIKLWEMRSDLEFFMHLNGTCITLRERPINPPILNTSARTPYQGAMRRLTEDLFNLSEDTHIMQDRVENILMFSNNTHKNARKNSQTTTPHLRAHQFKDLSLYTALALRHYLFELIGLDYPLLASISAITDTIQVLVESVIPQLAALNGTEADIKGMSEFVLQVKGWWQNTPYSRVRANSKKNLDVVPFLKVTTPSVLLEQIKTPLLTLKNLIPQIHVIMAMHPSDCSIPSLSADKKVHPTPIHSFSLRLAQICQRILIKTEAIVQFMGSVEEVEECKANRGFVNFYGALRSRYMLRFKNSFETVPRLQVSDRVSPGRELNNPQGSVLEAATPEKTPRVLHLAQQTMPESSQGNSTAAGVLEAVTTKEVPRVGLRSSSRGFGSGQGSSPTLSPPRSAPSSTKQSPRESEITGNVVGVPTITSVSSRGDLSSSAGQVEVKSQPQAKRHSRVPSIQSTPTGSPRPHGTAGGADPGFFSGANPEVVDLRKQGSGQGKRRVAIARPVSANQSPVTPVSAGTPLVSVTPMSSRK